MPTYDYLCDNCQFAQEVFHGMNETPAMVCPRCNKSVMKKCLNYGHVYVRPGDNECTLGLLADRNTNRFSDDQKASITEKNKTKKTHRINEKGQREPL